MNINVSIGEVVDKWTILSIKALNITDKDKLVNIFKERTYLNTVIEPDILHDPLTDQLLVVNKSETVAQRLAQQNGLIPSSFDGNCS